MPARWSKLVLPHLATLPFVAVGCAEAPPKPVDHPQPPTPPASTSAPPAKPVVDLSDPPDAKPGIGPFVGGKRKDGGKRVFPLSAEVTQYGKGAVATFALTEQGRCAVKTPNGRCTFARFAAWKDAARGKTFRAPASESDFSSWSAPMPWENNWGALTGSKDGLLGVRSTDGIFIDRIDETGKATEIVGLAQSPPINDVVLIELADGFELIGMSADNEGVGMIGAVGVRKEGEKWAVHHFTPLKISPALGGTAEAARYVKAAGRKVMWGSFSAAPVLDDKGDPTKEWALAWTEVIPPAKYTPAGIAPGVRGGKNGCGRGSRPLSDVSVIKRTHVTLYDHDGRQKLDRTVNLEIPPDDWPSLALTSRPDGFDLNGLTLDKQLREGKGGKTAPPTPIAVPPLEARRTQTLQAAGYHQKDGEGLVIYSEGDNQLAQRWSPRGEAVGDVIDIPNQLKLPPLTVEALEHAGETWVALEASGDSVALISGPQAGKAISIASERSWVLQGGGMWIIQLDETRVEVVRHTRLPKSYLAEIGVGDARGAALVSSIVDVKAGTATPWSLFPMWYAGEAVAARLSTVRAVARARDGGLIVLGDDADHHPVAIHRAADGAWKQPVPLGEQGETRAMIVGSATVLDDTVAILSGGGQLVGTWLDQGRTVALGRGSGHGGGFGPLLLPSDGALAAEPGAPAKLPKEISTMARDCPFQFATGARRAVMVCAEPDDANMPGRTIGWHVVRY